jgi:hypothetical protein
VDTCGWTLVANFVLSATFGHFSLVFGQNVAGCPDIVILCGTTFAFFVMDLCQFAAAFFYNFREQKPFFFRNSHFLDWLSCRNQVLNTIDTNPKQFLPNCPAGFYYGRPRCGFVVEIIGPTRLSRPGRLSRPQNCCVSYHNKNPRDKWAKIALDLCQRRSAPGYCRITNPNSANC